MWTQKPRRGRRTRRYPTPSRLRPRRDALPLGEEGGSREHRPEEGCPRSTRTRPPLKKRGEESEEESGDEEDSGDAASSEESGGAPRRRRKTRKKPGRSPRGSGKREPWGGSPEESPEGADAQEPKVEDTW